ncbi:MAG: ferredoxin--NADP+ reductase [Candidatus Omnitrophota bacterium]|jgi:ferredoxin--NADP+ reductase
MAEKLGTTERPLRVAIVGSGPSGFYAAEALFKSDFNVVVNMFERLTSPFGLVRYGVAPDHGKIKNVIKVYERTAENENFNYFGNVSIGDDLSIHQLRKFHDAVIFAYGAASDRKLGIVGEGLRGSHTATEFVAWYNGHPDFKDLDLDLSGETAVIIGQGNVALDVARILCKTVDELKSTDIAQHALDVLAKSNIKNVHIVGRRGPAQTAFTPSEIREFGQLDDCNPVIDPEELNLNEASKKELEDPANTQKKKNVDILNELVKINESGKSKKAYIQFHKSPSAIYDKDGNGRLDRIYLEKNELIGEAGSQKSRGTDVKEIVECSLLFRSVGYRGLPLEGLAFDDRWGIVPNINGRICDSEHISTGLYATGWIKRGPSGVVGTNKACAAETVSNLLEDIDVLISGKNPSNKTLSALLDELNIRYITFDDWKVIDAEEIKRGEAVGKPREKIVDIKEVLRLLDS